METKLRSREPLARFLSSAATPPQTFQTASDEQRRGATTAQREYERSYEIVEVEPHDGAKVDKGISRMTGGGAACEATKARWPARFLHAHLRPKQGQSTLCNRES